jgi:hypothetical protein
MQDWHAHGSNGNPPRLVTALGCGVMPVFSWSGISTSWSASMRLKPADHPGK